MNYWERRQLQLNSQMEKDEEALKKRLSSYYDTEYRKLEKQIAGYYHYYGEDNVIKYRNLMESLSEEDKRLLIEQMDNFGEKYPEYEHLLPIRESIYKLNQLEGLQTSVRMQQLEIGAVNNKELQKHLDRQALRGANATAEALGFGTNFYANNPDITKRFVNVAWTNDKDFSTRIWENTDKLANYLNTDIAQGIARGDSYDRLMLGIKKRFDNVTRNDAFRLLYTEGTYIMAESTMQPFVEFFEKYRISTVGDGKVCPICRTISQQIFDIRDRRPGVNFPPFHAWCRCTFTIEVDNWNEWMKDYESKYGKEQAEKVANRFMPSKKMLAKSAMKSKERDNDTSDFIAKMQLYYENNRNVDMKVIGREILDSLNLNDIPVNVVPIREWGYCRLQKNGDILHIMDYSLNINDDREKGYRVKTAFHEAYHAKAHGLRTDFGNIPNSHWLAIEETFAESSAHYIAKEMGITDLVPSYPDRLMDILPRLKQLPEFSSCAKISDFGRIALENRMNGVESKWEVLYNKAKEVQHDWTDYSKQYFPEIDKDIEGYVDKMLENMPQYTDYRSNMIADARNAMNKVNEGNSLSSNEELVLANMACIAMNRLGVR